MKVFYSPLRILLLAALLAGTALGIRPVTQARAEGSVIIVTTEEDGYGVEGCSLFEAIDSANWDSTSGCGQAGNGHDTIVFADDVHHINLTDSLPIIFAGLTIDGGGDVTIDGGSAYRIFTVYPHVAVTLDSLTFVNGSVGANYCGGAILNDGGTLTVDDSVFYNNQAGCGGAIFNGGDGTLGVINSLFSYNYATNGGGGAVLTDGGHMFFHNNTFRWNSATAGGGDLYMVSDTTELYNNLFAESHGGGHCQLEGSASIVGYNNLFQDDGSACSLTNNVAGNLVGVDPQFDPNIWYALKSTSPAIDAGAGFCPSLSWSGYVRPQGIRCDIGAYEYPQTLVRKYVVSTAAQDGWVLESTATSSVGGSRSSAGSTIPIGDTAQKQQRVGIFSFDLGAAGSLPVPLEDLVGVSLWLKPAGACGTTAPFSSLGNLLVDVRKGSFANNLALQAKDFQALATKKAAWSLDGTLTDGWLMKQLSLADFQLLNWSGVTQIRVRFAKGNNSNARADCLKIYSSEEPTHLMQPQLVVDYYVR
jgi:hypothetical protein